MTESLLIRNISRLFTSDTAGVIAGAAVLVEDGLIAWVGPEAELAVSHLPIDVEDLDAGGGLVTAGLVDAHTHPVYGGDRFEEIAKRSTGASYAEIAAMGGGISATVAATRAAEARELEWRVRSLLAAWLAGGTTTVEAKSGYFLEREGELGCLRLLRACSGQGGMPSVEVTFLGAHAVPPERSGDAEGYAAEVATWCAAAVETGARHADVFCDEGYFTPEQSRHVLTAARKAGLLPRIHADELAHTGGARLAAELGCTSADHLLFADEQDAAALAAAGTVATLAPVTALAMGVSPPARMLAQAGVAIALGSDHNPGMSGTTSMPLVVALAVAELGLSVEEALVAATSGGAASLRLADRGRVAPGLRADLVVWEAEHEGAFAWAYGLQPASVLLSGVPVR